jgi:orotidine-5'-phosphate decarboxylase
VSVAERVIVPLDVSSEREAIALVEQLPQVTFWKVGLELFVSSGPSILTALKARQKRIFLDLKFHDIPNTVAGACRAAARHGVDLVTLHATNGKEALQAAQVAAEAGAAETGNDPPKLLAITLLTSLTARSLAFELKVPPRATRICAAHGAPSTGEWVSRGRLLTPRSGVTTTELRQ